MRHPIPPPPSPAHAPLDDAAVARLAQEAGRRAVAAARARLREKAATRPNARPLADGAPAASVEAPPAPRRRRPARPGANRRRRRARRLRQTALATLVLGAVSVFSVSAMYQWIGSAPPPPIAANGQPGPDGTNRSTPPTLGAGPDAAGPGQHRATPAVPAPVWTAAAPAPAAPPASGDATTPQAQAPVPPSAGAVRVTAGGRGAAAVLPFLPGSRVVESDPEPQQAPGGGTTWAATLSSHEPLDRVAAYYRQLLGAGNRPGGPSLTEVNPGPGQLLLSLGNPMDGSHSAVWIGESEGQVLIRLMRTQGGAAPP